MISLIGACEGAAPSARMNASGERYAQVSLPVPKSASSVPAEQRLSRVEQGESYTLSARSLIPLAFDLQPNIKSSFQRFKSEEARYDFFFASLDSLTPRLRASNTFSESRARTTPAAGATPPIDTTSRQRDHSLELSVEKRFFDTTELNLRAGLRAISDDDSIGNQPFLSADLRYPLWASREKLERASEDIFRRNELDDTQLNYIQQVRRRLQDALFQFHLVLDLRRRVQISSRWQKDLESLLERLQRAARLGAAPQPPQPPLGKGGRPEPPLGKEGRPGVRAAGVPPAADLRRIEAEITKVRAEVRNRTGRYEIDVERLKSACGLPFNTRMELSNEPFNPFEGADHETLLRLSIKTDPEISTLRNAVRNSEVQLDLARRGRWDMALLLSGQSNLEGHGSGEGVSDWTASVGFEISAVDSRVTDSLTRQAEANIARFTEAIAARENRIFVDTLEPLIRIETLGTSRDELMDNLPRYEQDYQDGVEEYWAAKLNIDDLLKRREALFDQQQEISLLEFLVGANVAELCTATGKFFEILDARRDK